MKTPEIYEKHYRDYCAQIAGIDLDSIRERLGAKLKGDRLAIPFFGTPYFVSAEGIADEAGRRPGYMVCVILAKYILSCPDRDYHDPEWVSFKDMKRTSHFTNVNFFASDTEKAIAGHFAGRLDGLARACLALGGMDPETAAPYDLAVRFDALPRISLLMLFNDRDAEFPAQCKVLFQKHVEYFLDPESLGLIGACLARGLKQAG